MLSRPVDQSLQHGDFLYLYRVAVSISGFTSAVNTSIRVHQLFSLAYLDPDGAVCYRYNAKKQDQDDIEDLAEGATTRHSQINVTPST